MYQNPYSEGLVQKIDRMNRKKVSNMDFIDSGYLSGGRMDVESVRKIGGVRKTTKKMKGEGILSDIGGMVEGIFGLGKKTGQRKYKKQSESVYGCGSSGGSGFARGTHMDTGFDYTEGAGFSGGMKKWSPEELKQMEYLFFGKGRAKKMKEKLEGAGFWGDFWDGFKQGFSGTMDLASKALPVVAPFIGLGKRKRTTTRSDLELMGKMSPKVSEKSQMMGSDMSGFGRRKKAGRRTEEMGDFSGMGSSGGVKKRPQNAWLQLVNKVRKEKGFRGVKDAIAYIKQHNLYHK